ncbi:MAG: hypothetical protein ACYSW1_16050, partial [Planctomycetota bacterium]
VVDGVDVPSVGGVTCAIVRPEYSDGRLRTDWTRVIPLAPIWPGFAVDTLFYAAIWAALLLLLVGPGAVRRTARAARGLCGHCGYDLRHAGHEACPECGKN